MAATQTYARIGTDGKVETAFPPPSGVDEWIAAGGWQFVRRVLPDYYPTILERTFEVDPTSQLIVEVWKLPDPAVVAERARVDSVAAQLKTDSKNDLKNLREAIDNLAVLLGDNVTVGSYRQWKAQDNATITSAAGLKNLVDLLINHAQATRRVARQTLRNAKITADDFSSADVGNA